MTSKILKDKLKERFSRYVRIWTTSDSAAADNGMIPSTSGQMNFAKMLADELKSMGINNAELTGDGYVTASIDATPGVSNEKSVMFAAHIDTSEEVSGKDVKPMFHENYAGESISLQDGVVLNPADDRLLAKCAAVGDTIITSDGTTLLGADDKAGIAAIMTAIEYLLAHPEIPHCKIELLFNPDEETGYGMDKVPLDKIKSKVLIISCKQDPHFPPELDAIPMSNMINDSQLIIMDSKLGHLCFNELETISSELKEFMGEFNEC
jgi:tripeptide aminopeptidase